MTFIVTLIALLIERFFDWSHLRCWHWYIDFQYAVMRRLPAQRSYLVLALTIVPLLIGVAIVQFLLKDTLYGFAELLFQLIVFLYCLGPQNLWADTFACINAAVHGDSQSATEKVKMSFGVTDAPTAQSLHGQLLNHIFIAANRRVFAVVFWFIVLGPVGAVLYRTVTLSSSGFPKQEAVPELVQSASSIESVLDWIPIRLFTFIFALGGHFVKVVLCWRKKEIFKLDENEKLLTDCGTAALGNDEVEKVLEDGSVERSAIGLLDRAFVITLVIIAIVVLLI